MTLFDEIARDFPDELQPLLRGFTQSERLRLHRMMALIERLWRDAKEMPLQSVEPYNDATAQAMDALAMELLDLACRLGSPEFLAEKNLDEVER